MKKAELLVESIKQSETQLNNRVDGLQVNVDDSNMVINESQRRQHDLREEVEILRKGLNMQVREYIFTVCVCVYVYVYVCMCVCVCVCVCM